MTDYVWPDDLVPFQQSFWLQPHTGGTESPFSRQSKVYELNKPRWMCSMSFRGGYDGIRAQRAYGPRLDAMIAKLRGRVNRVAIYDFRRTGMRGRLWNANAGNGSASAGATGMTITGLTPGAKIHAGDYIGGDGRPHIILEDAEANGSGEALIGFLPALATGIGANAATFGNPTAIFKLVDDDAGQNPVEVGGLQIMTLNFVEDL